MKKVISLILVLLMCLPLCACESREERELRQAQEDARQAAQAYDDALRQYNDVQRIITQLPK